MGSLAIGLRHPPVTRRCEKLSGPILPSRYLCFWLFGSNRMLGMSLHGGGFFLSFVCFLLSCCFCYRLFVFSYQGFLLSFFVLVMFFIVSLFLVTMFLFSVIICLSLVMFFVLLPFVCFWLFLRGQYLF